MKNRLAVVTGGAGFIGSHLVDLLISEKYKVIVIDNLSGGHIANIKKHFKNKNFIFLKNDICKLKKKSIFKNVNYVFHFAGKGDIVPSIENPKRYLENNLVGTINLLEVFRGSKVKKFIYAASSSCYGLIKKKIVDESHPIDIKHPYALSKFLAEEVVLHWGAVYKLPVISIRIFNAYGPRVRTTGAYGAALGVFFKQKIENKPLTVIGDGKQSRDFIHVKDVANAFYLASKSKLTNEVFNLGTGKSQTVNHLCKLIGGKTVQIPNRPGEAKHSTADISKIKKLLKWRPLINFDNAINDLIKNHLAEWKKAPLWTAKKINKASKNWFKYIK